ncbi:hypothetical protein OKW21_002974 [Catalinimonas alkaloidigena]|uniref:porin family protein n=1 Tax=Catalinimonas alkaloidigena TaxID=1075417 RepID=UPI0024058319|nr:porin family protein [Catalinimonas alkaloidigena]MDF9797711.1 hypothetical protein [Catalinimonas alkaloidigena]
MKRILLITAALSIFAFSSSYAQLFTMGPKIGISSSKISVDDAEAIASGDAAVGFHAGAFARISILGFYVQPEALFTSAKGNIVIDDDNLENNAESIQELTYNKLDVPVMLGFKIGPLIRLNAGPTFSFILGDDIRNDAGAAIDQVEQDYNSANVGYQVGVGLDISKIIIDLKYENNLSALGESVTFAGETFPTDMRNRLFQLSLGYKLF